MTATLLGTKQHIGNHEQPSKWINWLGFVPATWNVMPLKFAASERTQKLDVKPQEGIYIGLEHIESGTGRLNLSNVVEEVASSVVVFQRGDVVFGKLRPYLAKAFLAEFDGVATSEVIVYQPSRKVLGRYLLYLMLSEPFIKTVDAMTYGSKMPRANSEQIGALPMPVPPLEQQRRIAAYLDRETARIDALIAAKEELLQTLALKRQALITHAVTRGLDASVPLKDSGLPWLGEIPAHWRFLPLKYLATIQTGVTLGKRHLATTRLELRPYLRVANVQDGYIDTSEVTEVAVPVEEVARYELRPGDVLLTEGGDLDKLGRGQVWHGQIEGCLHQNHIFAVRPYAVDLLPEFLAALTSSTHGKNYFTSTGIRTTNLATTNSTKVLAFPVPTPSLEEQKSILRFLEQSQKALISLKKNTVDTIQSLQQRRAAVIAAAVTGQINVEGAAACG